MDGTTQEQAVGEASRADLMEAIVNEHESALLRYATRMLHNPHAAQDAVQNVFIRLFQAWQDGWRPSGRIKSWLYRATHNEAVDQMRKETRRRTLHEKAAIEQTQNCPDGIHCPNPSDTRMAQVLEHLDRLHPRERQVILLRLEEGLSYADIAQVTGRSEGNVGNILHHAAVKLSRSLAGRL